jgi:prevent-host-death family protein
VSIHVTEHEAKMNLSALLDRVVGGEEVIIAKEGTPVARLIPMLPVLESSRVPGSRLGRMRMADDFDEPLPDDFLTSEHP